MQNQIREVLANVIPHEIGWDVEYSHPSLQFIKLKWFNPRGIIVLSDRFEQPLPQLAPFILCHSAPHTSRINGLTKPNTRPSLFTGIKLTQPYRAQVSVKLIYTVPSGTASLTLAKQKTSM